MNSSSVSCCRTCGISTDRIAAQLQACREGQEALAAAEAAHGEAASGREEFARAEQAQVARADHDELARLTLEVQQQELLDRPAWPPSWQQVEPVHSSRPRCASSNCLPTRLPPSGSGAPCNPSSSGRRSSIPGIKEKGQPVAG